MKSLFRLLWAAATVSVLVGCAGPVVTPVFYVLRAEAPIGVMLPPGAPASATPWQLVLPVRVPDYLDREALLLPQGNNGLLASPTHRWAELLSQSVPRLLAYDLSLLGGEGSVWTGSVPRGLAVRGQLRVELLALDVNGAATAVTLKARWTTSATDGAAQPVARSHSIALTSPSLGPDADSLVSAHRQVLWQLAQAITKTLE